MVIPPLPPDDFLDDESDPEVKVWRFRNAQGHYLHKHPEVTFRGRYTWEHGSEGCYQVRSKRKSVAANMGRIPYEMVCKLNASVEEVLPPQPEMAPLRSRYEQIGDEL